MKTRKGITWIELLVLLAVICVLGACLMPEALLGLLQIVARLALGWFAFINDVFPKMTMDWEVLATAIICLAGLGIGAHYLCSWIHGQIFRAIFPSETRVKRWQKRWTGGLLAIVIIMFVAGIAVVGITHQTVWLVSSPEPLVRRSRSSYESESRNNLKQMGLAILMYHDEFGEMPSVTFDAQGRALHGWQTMILPFIEQDHLFKEIKQDSSWHQANNRECFQSPVEIYLNPNEDERYSPDGYALSHYAGNVYVFGANPPLRLADFSDGTSKTLMVGEAFGNFKPWGRPTNWRDPGLGINASPDGFGSPTSSKGANFVMVDGSIHFISEKVSPEVLKALAMPSGRPKISDDWDD
jgi:Protein of unknown function (DUF1559)